MNGLTADEQMALTLLADAANVFNALPVQHPSDADEYVRAIHAAQNIILSRVAYRTDPKFCGFNAGVIVQ